MSLVWPCALFAAIDQTVPEMGCFTPCFCIPANSIPQRPLTDTQVVCLLLIPQPLHACVSKGNWAKAVHLLLHVPSLDGQAGVYSCLEDTCILQIWYCHVILEPETMRMLLLVNSKNLTFSSLPSFFPKHPMKPIKRLPLIKALDQVPKLTSPNKGWPHKYRYWGSQWGNRPWVIQHQKQAWYWATAVTLVAVCKKHALGGRGSGDHLH